MAQQLPFVVYRINWRPDHIPFKDTTEWRLVPGDVIHSRHATADEAAAVVSAYEADARKQVNPFCFGQTLADLTHLEEPQLRDWLQDHDVDPPKKTKTWKDWFDWYKKLAKKRQAVVWEALTKLRFARYEKRPGTIGYAVVQLGWEYNDNYDDACPEGVKTTAVYRSREAAEQEAERLSQLAAAEKAREMDMDPDEESEYEVAGDRSWVETHMDPFHPDKNRLNQFPKRLNDVGFYRVVDVDLEGL